MAAGLRDRCGSAADRVIVASAGIRGPAGLPMQPRAIEELRRRGVSAAGFVSRVIGPGDPGWAALLLTATRRQRDILIGTDPVGLRARTFTWRELAWLLSDADAGGLPGHGLDERVEAVAAFAGARRGYGAGLTATTVRNLTGVTLDGAMIANFASIRDLVDTVGGVNVCVPYDVRSTFTSMVWKQGCHDLDGDLAEEFMRQRYEVPGGDFGRMHNQQLVVKAIIAKVSADGTLADPLKLDGLIGIAADSLTVDESLDLRDLAFAVKGIRPAAISYATVPYSSASLRTPAGTAVQLDTAKSASMFAAIKDDTIDQWLAANPQRTPGS